MFAGQSTTVSLSPVREPLCHCLMKMSTLKGRSHVRRAVDDGELVAGAGAPLPLPHEDVDFERQVLPQLDVGEPGVPAVHRLGAVEELAAIPLQACRRECGWGVRIRVACTGSVPSEEVLGGGPRSPKGRVASACLQKFPG